ncbi:MAG: FIST N-terminal domain-containing protein [Planctomycetota bacterium]
MKTEQWRWQATDAAWKPHGRAARIAPQIAFVFGEPSLLRRAELVPELRSFWPGAVIVGCSTAGEICDTEVTDATLVATAVEFEHTRVMTALARLGEAANSRELGTRLAHGLPHDGLVHAFVLCDGLHVNGSELVQGLTGALPPSVAVTGGLSGDGSRFAETLVRRDAECGPDRAVAVGFYGDRLRVGCASLGGWDTFGPERTITRASGNVLYELDGRSALALYRKYLGHAAEGLPATGLLFPLSVRIDGHEPVVRTILSIDEHEQSMTFAGDVPQGALARLMRANFDRLIDGAVGAAQASQTGAGAADPDLAILISCVGRKLVLKQRVEEEVEGVRQVLGARPVLTGFYSYGEISPFVPNARCELHNQTMTITTLAER